MFSAELHKEIRSRFLYVNHCPYQGERIFFENAGGSLILKSVIDTSIAFSAYPDNHGRDNIASKNLSQIIKNSENDIRFFFGSQDGIVIMGESGTELLFRLIRSSICISEKGSSVLGTTLEHPATISARRQWSNIIDMENINIAHDPHKATVTSNDYADNVRTDTKVATIIHTNPVTGTTLDVNAIATAIRTKSPDCYIIVDSIQRAAHGSLNINAELIDACVLSGYKVFSKHNYGIAWLSSRLSNIPHEKLDGTANNFWNLGTRDTTAYAAFSEVVHYFDWLGSQLINSTDKQKRFDAASLAISKHESELVNILINGTSDTPGIKNLPGIYIIGGLVNPYRESLVSFTLNGISSEKIVQEMNNDGIRMHVRKADYFSGNVLAPLGLKDCIRVSFCHYNSSKEVTIFLTKLKKLVDRLH